MTMQVIQHQELSSSQAGIDFTSIPQTYTDLLLVYSVRTDNTDVPYSNTRLLFNGSTSNFTSKRMFGGGSGSVESYTDSNLGGLVSSNGSTADTFGSTRLYITNYASSSNKSFSIDSVSENNGTSAYQEIIGGVWAQTSAITSITVDAESTRNFLPYSSATLYGITKGSDGIVTVS